MPLLFSEAGSLHCRRFIVKSEVDEPAMKHDKVEFPRKSVWPQRIFDLYPSLRQAAAVSAAIASLVAVPASFNLSPSSSISWSHCSASSGSKVSSLE